MTDAEILSKQLRSRTKTGRERLAKLRRYLTRTNKAFKKMSTPRKKVQIAKDVIVQLDLGRLSAGSTYFGSAYANEAFEKLNNVEGAKNTHDVQEVLATVPSCEVCGIGACFVATIDRMDKLQLRDAYNLKGQSDQRRYLSRVAKLFSVPELARIERTFESNYHVKPNYRLRLIMERIIKHKGCISEDTFDEIYEKIPPNQIVIWRHN